MSRYVAATFRDVKKYVLSGTPTSADLDIIGHSNELSSHAVLWGPVTREAARAAGCVAPASSVLLKPADIHGFAEARAAALACIDPAIYPRPDDTPKSLAARLRGCTFLDEIHAKWGGHGRNGRWVDLNSSTYAQPRRATFSVKARDATCPETEWLFAYTQHGRPPEDFRCRPMPMAFFEFGVVLWKIARPLMLGNTPSLWSPPTALQLMACEMPAQHGHGHGHGHGHAQHLHVHLHVHEPCTCVHIHVCMCPCQLAGFGPLTSGMAGVLEQTTLCSNPRSRDTETTGVATMLSMRTPTTPGL